MIDDSRQPSENCMGCTGWGFSPGGGGRDSDTYRAVDPRAALGAVAADLFDRISRITAAIPDLADAYDRTPVPSGGPSATPILRGDAEIVNGTGEVRPHIPAVTLAELRDEAPGGPGSNPGTDPGTGPGADPGIGPGAGPGAHPGTGGDDTTAGDFASTGGSAAPAWLVSAAIALMLGSTALVVRHRRRRSRGR